MSCCVFGIDRWWYSECHGWKMLEDSIRKPQAPEIPAGEHHPKVSEKFPKVGKHFETQQDPKSPSVVCQECNKG